MKKCLFACAIAVLSLVFFTESSFGFGWRRGRCGPVFRSSCVPVSRPIIHHKVRKPIVHVKKEIVIEEVPIAYPVLVPAYSFQYQQPCYTTNPASPVVNYQAPYGQQHQNNYGQVNMQNQRDMIRELARALLEEMNRLAQEDELRNGPPVVTGPFNSGNPSPPPPVNQEQQLQAAAFRAMSRACSSCHTGVGSKGDAKIFIQQGLLNLDAPWEDIKRKVGRGQMPPKDSQWRLTSSEYDAIMKYADYMMKKTN